MYQSLEYADIFKVLIEFSPGPARREKRQRDKHGPGLSYQAFFVPK